MKNCSSEKLHTCAVWSKANKQDTVTGISLLEVSFYLWDGQYGKLHLQFTCTQFFPRSCQFFLIQHPQHPLKVVLAGPVVLHNPVKVVDLDAQLPSEAGL